jgi:hypothetical protein
MQNNCTFEFKLFDLSEMKYIKLFLVFLLKFFKKKITFKIIVLPKKISKYTVIRSPHVFNTSREQFELSFYKVLVVCQSPIKFNIFSLRLLTFLNGVLTVRNSLFSLLLNLYTNNVYTLRIRV